LLPRRFRLAGGLPAAAALMRGPWFCAFTPAAPTAAPIVHPVTSLRQAVVGPPKILRATGRQPALADPLTGAALPLA